MKKFSKLRKLNKVLRTSIFLDKPRKKAMINYFFCKVSNNLFFALSAMDILENKLKDMVNSFDEQVVYHFSRKTNFFFEKNLSYLPWWSKAYPKLREYFYNMKEKYAWHNNAYLALFANLLMLVYVKNIFRKYNKIEYFEKFIKNIPFYIKKLHLKEDEIINMIVKDLNSVKIK